MTAPALQTPHMTPDTETSPIVDFWIDVMAPKFLKYRHILVGGLRHHSAAIIPGLPIRRGDRALDVGCGFGDTAIALAGRTGDRGSVLGIDCVPAFVAQSWHAAEQMLIDNVSFACRDAERSLPRGEFDYVFARFGTMFFSNPVAGLRNMRKALKPGGRMTHVVWRDREANPWLSAAREVLLTHLPRPDATAPSCGPGPFSMADKTATRAIMEAAGFRNIRFGRIDAKVLVGRTAEEAIAFQLALGPAGEIFRLAGGEAQAKRAAIEKDLHHLFDAVPKDESGLWMDSSSWVIHADAAD
ncbi:MAG: class I SAM-dependent methyltransferase [Roseibium sp.]|uniref:class I SAM-dependent methyltransferase n=1 Tax=Roseibium sp. TaxID=1936156 RepID=UPI003D9C5A11